MTAESELAPGPQWSEKTNSFSFLVPNEEWNPVIFRCKVSDEFVSVAVILFIYLFICIQKPK